jgi:Xaa-Pro aminopeptidase
MNAEELRLPFEPGEYDRRVRALRRAMAEAGIEVLLATGPENVWYLSGFRTGTAHVFTALVLPLEGEAFWVLRKTELSNSRAVATVSWVKQAVGVPDGTDPPAVLAETLAASERGLATALDRIEPGMTSDRADKIMRETIETAGCGDEFVVRAAYGIGLSSGPTWGEDRLMALRPGDERIVEPGMCFHLVPALYRERLGCVCCSMPVVVTETGLDPLLDLEAKLFVKA